MTDTAELKKLANAATPGLWFVGSKTDAHWKRAVGFGDKPAVNSIVFCGHSEDQAHKDAAYIAAANPVVVIELLDTIDRLTEAREAQPMTDEEAKAVLNDFDIDDPIGSVRAVENYYGIGAKS